MSNVQTEVRRGKPAPRGAIVVADENEETRGAILNRIKTQFGDNYEVVGTSDLREAANEVASLQDKRDLEVSVIVVAAHTLLDELPALSADDCVTPTTKIIAYADTANEQLREKVLKAGASACVELEDVEATVYGVLLEKELGGLGVLVPTAEHVLQTINACISIVNPQMKVLWYNDRTKLLVGGAEKGDRTCLKTCWELYHAFHNRTWPCTNCTTYRVLSNAVEKIKAGEPVGNGLLTDHHLLPVKGEIVRVRVNAAPLVSRDGSKVLALTDATRNVTKEWEESTPAHKRLREVITAAQAMGQEHEDASPFEALAVYYRPEKSEHLHLFDSTATDDDAIPKLVRLDECPAAYQEALEELDSRIFEETAPDAQQRHFVWAGKTPKTGTFVLIDVQYADDKPEGLFTADLRPYWQYIVDHFEEAVLTREQTFQQATDSLLQAFLAQTANGVQDQASLGRVLQAAIECIKEALHPFSTHVRLVDRNLGVLVKRNGSGPYYDMAPEKRPLRHKGLGSCWTASTRRKKWNEQADHGYIRECLGRELTPSEEADVMRIASDVLLPLECMDRVLGTLCIQFDDDSLFSPSKCSFIEAVASALGSALGSLQWAQERNTLVERARELDKSMFRRCEHPEEEETRVLKLVGRMVFELTAAEVVAYYRYDAQTGTLTLAPDATHGSLPSGVALPDNVPSHVGIISQAAANKRGCQVSDYRGRACEGIRNHLIRHFRWQEAQHRFCLWLGSEIAEPVIADGTVKGVLVAMSSISHWLSTNDEGIVREFAFKTGLCLEAKYLMRKLNWSLKTEVSLNVITTAMARESDVSTLHRLLLLAVTANECLGFSRAILFLPKNGDDHTFVAAEAVGARTREAAQAQWAEAEAMLLDEKMRACSQPPRTREGDLREQLPHLVLDLWQHPEIEQLFRAWEMAVRRQDEPHIVHDASLRAILSPDGNDNCEYVLAPLTAGGKVTGVVLADRAFLAPSEIVRDRLELLQFMTKEFVLIREAIRLRSEDQEAKTAMVLVRGVNYTLRTRSALLEARISNLANALGGSHQEAIDRLKRAAEFFKRVGTIASKLLQSGAIRPGTGEKHDVNAVLAEILDVIDDPRIALESADCSVRVQVERHHLEDISLEILWNACDFANRDSGEIRVTVRVQDGMVRVDFADNGPGIHPDLRLDLFKPFKCYPASRARMGLGLSYVKSLVEAYGGTIREIGTSKQGAHFVVRIPLVEERNDEPS